MDFLPAILLWLQPDNGLPKGHRQISFMELALDFESHVGRPLPPTPQLRFAGTEMSLQAKGRVVQLAVTIGRTRVHSAVGHHCTLPLVGAARGRHSCRGERTTPPNLSCVAHEAK